MDVSLTMTANNEVIINWYQKSTNSGRYLNYFLHNSLSQKIGVVYTLVDSGIQNLSLTRSLLLQNNYPLTFINKYLYFNIYMHGD